MEGYAYKLSDPTKNGAKWDRANDDLWEMVIVEAKPGHVMGKRAIDGAEHIVVKKGKDYYAQTALSVQKCAPPKSKG